MSKRYRKRSTDANDELDDNIDMNDELSDADDQDEEDVEEEDALHSDSDKFSLKSTPPRLSSSHSRLKIKLKLPSRPSAATSNADDSQVARIDADVQSEDEDADTTPLSTRSASAGSNARPMTARQAVLASVVDSLHVSLVPAEPSRKRKQLNDAELALRREETARKRRNLSEKKLEDEKVETINRLLRKQSSRRKNRNAEPMSLVETATPSAGAFTPDPEGAENPVDDGPRVRETVVPQMYRWVSSVKDVGSGKSSGEKELKSIITFSVPLSVLSRTMGTTRAGGALSARHG